MSEIILGVGGGIAAYKSCDLLRRLQDLGHKVKVVPTPSSLNFVGKATWEALSGSPVYTEVWEAVDQVNHVKLGDNAEYIIIAPATADLIARLSSGRADDLLTNTVLASSAVKLLVPAMHPKMWLNSATSNNVQKLRELGFVVMEPAVGRLTGSDSGIGRFPDVSDIIEIFNNQIMVKKDLLGFRFLITTGGTREAIDDVRFIGNRSSGKQGIAIAQCALARGAEVTLISANVDKTEYRNISNLQGIKKIEVTNTAELSSNLELQFDHCDVLIMAAAVSDAKPISSTGKVKKSEYRNLQLEETPDLLAGIAKRRREKNSQILVGFAAEESQNLLREGKRKFEAKGLDFIYANDINKGSIFGSDMTSGILIDNAGATEISEISKLKLANLLLDKVSIRLKSPNV